MAQQSSSNRCSSAPGYLHITSIGALLPVQDVAAISDKAADFAGSCGRCYEVRCNPAMVKDGFGAEFDRRSVCYDPEASVVVRVVDACEPPCKEPHTVVIGEPA
jgi:hypothetical protein